MRFEWVRAEAFGPLVKRKLQFQDGLNLVCGHNEAGKSSWHAAIYAALCGRRRARGRPAEDQQFAERYRPWSGDEWRVSARIVLASGRSIELTHDLDGRVDCRALEQPTGRDVSNEILNDGAPDGAVWLGLDRRSFQAVACVRQAEITRIRDEAGNLQGQLQSAAASVAATATAVEALRRIDDFKGERVGSNRAPTKPLLTAARELENKRAGLERARQAQADYAALQRAVEAQRGDVAAAENRRRLAEAKLALLRATESEDRARRAAELARLFPAGEPRDLEDDSLLSEQVVTALRDWERRPREPGLQAVDLSTLEQRLAALPDPGPGDLEEDDQVRAAEGRLREARHRLDEHRQARPAVSASPAGPGRPTLVRQRLLLPTGLTAIALGALLLLAGVTVLGAIVALGGATLAAYALLSRAGTGGGELPSAEGWQAREVELSRALTAAEAGLLERLAARGATPGPRETAAAAYARYQEECSFRRQRAELERQMSALRNLEAAALGLRAAAAAAGVQGDGSEALAAALRRWQERRRERLQALDEARSRWMHYQALLGGLTLGELQAEAVRRRQTADSLVAGLDLAALEALVLEEDAEAQIEALRRTEQDARDGLARLEERLQGQLKNMPDAVTAAEEVEVAEAELRRLQGLERILDLTKSFLEEASRRAHRSIAPDLQKTLQRWLPLVTHGRYVDALVDPQNLEVKVRSEGGSWRVAESLSHGTAEQVYLLLRVALAQYLSNPDEPCPLILDDVTAQSDAQRTTAILEALAELSAERQVIFFSQEEEVLQWGRANPARCHLIELDVLAPAR